MGDISRVDEERDGDMMRNRSSLYLVGILLLALIILTGCGRDDGQESPDSQDDQADEHALHQPHVSRLSSMGNSLGQTIPYGNENFFGSGFLRCSYVPLRGYVFVMRKA